ncbi:TolC family protein [Thiohalophilus thiocyanatoxydans]|uniref:Outer membrane protein TolC n=1 Tax=Thiohalophilus thiocyanatoxydans TaxID=381308 RepID=A0A4V3H4R9_9GAMM|nr:TolC family protein [Thiohalophilus thiocyanatoxydans]TDY04235.1 outer membrane protein TolC [Thiohalophilus thiocyanatoxydans]
MLRLSMLCGVVLATLTAQPLLAASTLTLEESIRLALDNDPGFRITEARSAALKEQAVADKALPDPKLKLGLMNFPTDTFERDQEAMTQVQVGIQQMFPAGDSLKYKSERSLSRSRAQDHQSKNQRRKLVRDVRQAWLEWYYWHRAQKVVEENRDLYRNLVRVTESQYAAGRQQQQDVIRAELELGLLDDRLEDIRNKMEEAWAKLARYLGDTPDAMIPPEQFPKLPRPQPLQLDDHPMIQAARSEVEAEQNSVSLARQSYKPSWMLDVTYGGREGVNLDGSQRSDFLSAMVLMDIPLFTGNYQDRKVAAGKQKLQSALYSLKDRKRGLNRQWEESHSRWNSLADRLDRYQERLLPMARENAKSALQGYQSRDAEFSALMRARIMQLDTELKALRLRTDRARVQAQLLYIAGVAQ